MLFMSFCGVISSGCRGRRSNGAIETVQAPLASDSLAALQRQKERLSY